MNNSIAFLFPGQGSQSSGMLARLPQEAIIRDTLTEAAAVLRCNLSTLDTEAALQRTENAQLLLFVSGVAAARLLEQLLFDQRSAHAGFAAGHSVGAFAAAVFAGALDFADALQLVAARGRAMATAFPSGYGMGAITGLPQSDVESMVKRVHAENNPVFIANYNAPDQFVIAGLRPAVAQILELASPRARKAIMLNVAVPSHNELMSPVAQQLAEIAQTTPSHRPRIPCVSNSTARLLYDGPSILNDLVHSVARPVRWHDAMVAIYEAGARVFLEMPPGQVLTKLAASAFPDARCLSLDEAGIDSAVALAAPF